MSAATNERAGASGLVLDGELRDVFGRLADVMIPRSGDCPSATEADVHGPRIDRLLALRPDLKEAFLAALDACRDGDPGERARALSVSDPDALALVGMLAAISYYQDSRVRAAIGYPGQSHRVYDVDTEPDYMRNGQLQAVVDRGPIFRPTPAK